MPRDMTPDDEKEFFEAAVHNFLIEVTAATEKFRKNLGRLGYNAIEINQKIRSELEDIKEVYR